MIDVKIDKHYTLVVGNCNVITRWRAEQKTSNHYNIKPTLNIPDTMEPLTVSGESEL